MRVIAINIHWFILVVYFLMFLAFRLHGRKRNHRILHVTFSPEHMDADEVKRGQKRMGWLMALLFISASAVVFVLRFLSEFNLYYLQYAITAVTYLYVIGNILLLQYFQEFFLNLKRRKNWIYSENMLRSSSTSNPSRQQFGPGSQWIWIIWLFSFVPMISHFFNPDTPLGLNLLVSFFPLFLALLPLSYGRTIQFLEELSRQEGKESPEYSRELEVGIGRAYVLYSLLFIGLYVFLMWRPWPHYASYIGIYRDFYLDYFIISIPTIGVHFLISIVCVFFLFSQENTYRTMETRYYGYQDWMNRYGGMVDNSGRYRSVHTGSPSYHNRAYEEADRQAQYTQIHTGPERNHAKPVRRQNAYSTRQALNTPQEDRASKVQKSGNAPKMHNTQDRKAEFSNRLSSADFRKIEENMRRQQNQSSTQSPKENPGLSEEEYREYLQRKPVASGCFKVIFWLVFILILVVYMIASVR